MKDLKNIFIYSTLICFFAYSLSGCSKEDELSPSNLDRDWYTLLDSDDPLEHLQYEIFEEYGVPVFFNDTIGSRNEGIGYDGEDLIYYEVLDPNYTLGTYNEICDARLCKVDSDIEAGLCFVRDYVLARIDDFLIPRCFLLADTLLITRNTTTYTHEENVYRGLMVTTVGSINDLGSMSDEEKYDLATEVIVDEWATLIINNHYSLLDLFLDVSATAYDGETAYNKEVYEYYTWSGSIDWDDKEAYGFIDVNPDNQFTVSTTGYSKYYTPDIRGDLVDYLYVCLTMSEEEFDAIYSSYSYCTRKFELLTSVIEEIYELYQ